MNNFAKFLVLRKKKYGKYRIMKELNVTERSYYRYLKKEKNGIRSPPKRGRKPILNAETKAYIRNIVKKSKFLTTKDIHQKCKDLHKNSSIGTINKYLKSINYFHKKEKKSPFISNRNKKKRL